MKLKYPLLILGLLCCFSSYLDAETYGFNAFSSCASNSIHNANFASLNNPSQICGTKSIISYSISNPYGIKDIHSSGFILQTSKKQTAIGVSWENAGNSAYQNNKYGLSIAIQPTKELQIGLKGHISHFRILNYGLSKQSNIDLSFTTHVHPKIKSSFLLNNLFKYFYNQNEISNQATTAIWGLSYQVEKNLHFIFEVEKSSLSQLKVKSAISMHKDSIWRLNICASNGGKQLGLGLGIKKRKTELGFALSANIILGFSSCISIAYEIKS